MKGPTSKARNLTVGWNPKHPGLPSVANPGTAGIVERFGDDELDWSVRGSELDKWDFTTEEIVTGGVCTREELGMRKLRLFMLATHMMVRDGIEPIAVHHALLAFAEYRDGCADDMPEMR